MEWKNSIETNPNILYGKPVIKGTRIGVDLIIEKLSLGEAIHDILEAYPQITIDQVYSCLAYATSLIRDEEYYYLKTA